MSSIGEALPTIFLHEGLYSNDKNDPGGATNYGISLRFLKQTGDLDRDGWPDGDIDHDGDIDVDDIKKMTLQKASQLYDLYWWSKYGYGKLTDQAIATKVFDLSINMGSVGAHKCLQRAIRAATGRLIADDGVFGQITLNLANQANPVRLLPALKSEAAGYYRCLNKPIYIKGWLNRAYSDVVLSQ